MMVVMGDVASTYASKIEGILQAPDPALVQALLHPLGVLCVRGCIGYVE